MRLTLKKISLILLATCALCGFLQVPPSVASQSQKGKKPAVAAGEGPAVEQHHAIVSVEARPQLFATICALDAAGFDPGASGIAQSPGRAQLRERMLALQGPAVEALRTYYREHALADAGATFSHFVSFALAVGPPPKFAFELRRDELPPEALALEGFNVLLANFYAEAQLDQLWQHYQPDYERGVEMYRGPVSDTVFTLTSYLREIVKSNTPRYFSVYVEPLAGGKTNFRNYGDHYELVVSPAADFPADELRHAFLHFLLDPMAIRYRADAAKAAPLLEYAARAPRLPVEFHDDYSAFFTECLVRAVELRLRRLPPAELAAAIDQAETTGYVMVRPIYAGLAGFEKSEPAMGYYLPELIRGIDVGAESRRLRGVKFAEVAPVDEATSPAVSAPSVASGGAPTPAEQDLAEGRRQISARNGAAAAVSFERILAKNPNDARATYGLAVASTLQGKPERARELFAKVIADSSVPSASEHASLTDPGDLSWAHIYLGRMYDIEGQRDMAVEEYRRALAVNGAPEGARSAAQRGVETGYQTPSRDKK